MKVKCIRVEESVGKTVAGSSYGHGHALFRFTDSCVVALVPEQDDEVTEMDWLTEIDAASETWLYAAKRSGVISESQFNKFRDANQAKETAKKRKQLERLKRELGVE
jgi:hypothetical protein